MWVTKPETQPSLPADRAFIVQFRIGDRPMDDAEGRIEHVVTGAATHFAGWGELRAFVESVIDTAPPVGGGGGAV
jgi:hypothetical protein